jgi:hypothetical protein
MELLLYMESTVSHHLRALPRDAPRDAFPTPGSWQWNLRKPLRATNLT